MRRRASNLGTVESVERCRGLGEIARQDDALGAGATWHSRGLPAEAAGDDRNFD